MRAPKMVLQIDVDTLEIVGRYESLRDAARKSGFSHCAIGSACRDDVGRSNGYIWRYEEGFDMRELSNENEADRNLIDALKMLKKYHITLSLKELSRKTGFSCEELRQIYSRYKVYRFGGDE